MSDPPCHAFPLLEPLGDRALLLTLGDGVDEAVNGRVHGLARQFRAAGWPELEDVVPAYASIALHFAPMPPGRWEELEHGIGQILSSDIEGLADGGRVVEIPVHYGGAGGPDLAEVAAHTGLTEAEVVARHAAGTYRVHFLGFSPGFPYLGGLETVLATPRRATPRSRVPAGSVGIGGAQTGVYPMDSPGGWNLIGRTPLVLFDPHRAEPCLLQPGDRVRFIPLETP